MQEFKIEEFVLGLFEDGAYPAEVVAVNDDTVNINCLQPAVIQGKKDFRYWKWPSSVDNQTVSKLSVLAIRPSLDVAAQYSNRRNVVFELNNFELVQIFT